MLLTELNKNLVLPYVYKITHKESGRFYIGVRLSNTIPAIFDLGHTYFTSGVLKEHFRNYTTEYEISILEIFQSRTEAERLEQEYIKKSYFHVLNQNLSCKGIPNKFVIWSDKKYKHNKKYRNYISEMEKAGLLSNNTLITNKLPEQEDLELKIKKLEIKNKEREQREANLRKTRQNIAIMSKYGKAYFRNTT